MSDLKLVWTGQAVDLDTSGHRGNLVDGDDAVDQQLRIRLKFFLEEWFLDQRVGIPYYRDILIKNPSLDLIRSVFKAAILETPGVASVGTLELSIDAASRTLNLTFQATLDSGGTLTYSPFIIEV
jgi:hypothetical protein